MDTLERNVAPLADRSPAEILAWAAARFEHVAFSTGFGVEGCVLVDVIARHRLPIDVFTLDTGLLFPETYLLWQRLEKRYGISIRGVEPARTVGQQADEHGERLWERQPDTCCELRKLRPLREALREADAWVTAIRRDQTADRADASVVESDSRFGLIKINPLVGWTGDQVWSYVREHDVPYNRLHDRGYPSIGCWPCTSSVKPGESPRAGRWRGREKTECGLHARPVRSATLALQPQGGS
jgi:phosphoadenylyl-sulfate reductase (thioredoxin)